MNWEDDPHVRQMYANSIFGISKTEIDNKSYAEAINKIRESMYNHKPQVTTDCGIGYINGIDYINNEINEFYRQMQEYTERTLAEIVANYDFLVGSAELKTQLTEILPKGASIAYSPLIENNTTIFAIKKFDIMDILELKPESEE